MKKILIGTVGLFVFTAGPVFAGSSTKFPDSRLQVQTDNGIPYVSGGFGMDERENLRAMSKDDNLELSFAAQNGNYLGGAKVLVKNAEGKELLETNSDGPLFFTRLPAGQYVIEATAMGKTLEQVVHVPSKGQVQLHFTWKEAGHQTATS